MNSTPKTATSRGEVIASGVGLDYNGKAALDDASITVHAGEFFTLLGPSGSGKTTLLRIIAGLLDPDRGQIAIDGKDVTHTPTQKRDIGFVFQNYALFPYLTVAENIEFGLKVRKVDAAQRQKRLAEMIDLVALGGLADRYPAQLSGGQQQRVALGRALAQRPRVLLLDEPLGALDRSLRQDLGGEIRRIQQESETTAVYVTHDQEEAFVLSDRMGVMRDGKVSQIGTPEDLYRQPDDLFVARFLGQTNLFDGEIVGGSAGGTDVSLGGTTVTSRTSGLAVGTAVHCSVRPEQLVLTTGAVPEGHHALTTATVTQSRFLGQRQNVHLDADGRSVHADLDPYGIVPAVGDRVTLSVRIGQSALVPREA